MPDALKKLINDISLLPWIWDKTATKLAIFLLNSKNPYISSLKNSLTQIKENISRCNNCWSLTNKEEDLCKICKSQDRQKDIICIVEEYLDLLTIEQTWWYNWVYHVLGWAISPINWIFVADLNFKKLFERIEESSQNIELILATNPNIEWEATIAYIKEEIEKKWLNYKVKLTRLSRWLSSGYIEYADNITILNSIKERKEVR